jgi:hypothetical protein
MGTKNEAHEIIESDRKSRAPTTEISMTLRKRNQ